LRGPYGRGFSLVGRRVLIVAGGTGMAPLAPLVAQGVRARTKVDVVIGARSADELLFVSRAARTGASVHVATDDGSRGFRGFASELAGELIGKNHYDAVYACGPERMIVRMVRICSRMGVPLQASLERVMRCGIGLCDSCAIDGVHVCRDGPVFGLSELRRFKDLGRTKLDLAGRRTPV
ncbi:MAG: dihydroorotate dehydrogenase electron transfer subunit, partial [Thermoplasmata archaeon]